MKPNVLRITVEIPEGDKATYMFIRAFLRKMKVLYAITRPRKLLTELLGEYKLSDKAAGKTRVTPVPGVPATPEVVGIECKLIAIKTQKMPLPQFLLDKPCDSEQVSNIGVL
jgi:hypothetical protein